MVGEVVRGKALAVLLEQAAIIDERGNVSTSRRCAPTDEARRDEAPADEAGTASDEADVRRGRPTSADARVDARGHRTGRSVPASRARSR